MLKRLIAVLIFSAMAFTAGSGMATDQEQSRQTMQQQEQVFGWELMTQEERIEHRDKMRSLQSQEERESYRLEHHAEMEKRARERGVVLPEMIPQSQGRGPGLRGKGLGPGGGQGR